MDGVGAMLAEDVQPALLSTTSVTGVDVPPASKRLHILNGTNEAPTSVGDHDAALVKHLASSRPLEPITTTLCNGSMRTSNRARKPRRTVVGVRQAQRRAMETTGALGRILCMEAEFLSAETRDTCLRAKNGGGMAHAPAAALKGLPVRLQNQFIDREHLE